MPQQAKSSAPPEFQYDASSGKLAGAIGDILDGLTRFALLRTMVSSDFAMRYRGTMLGAFWLTATSFMTVLGLGLVYSQVFAIDFRTYLPYVAIGMIVWGLVQGFITDGPGVFTSSASTFSQIRVPLTLFALSQTGRLLLTFAYRSVVILALVAIDPTPPTVMAILQALGGLGLVIWIGFWMVMLLGILGARMRDLSQFMAAAMTFAFFLTPVFWYSEKLGDYQWVVNYNPLHHILNTVRGPLLELEGVAMSFGVTGAIGLVLPIIAFVLFARFKHRIPYWC